MIRNLILLGLLILTACNAAQPTPSAPTTMPATDTPALARALPTVTPVPPTATAAATLAPTPTQTDPATASATATMTNPPATATPLPPTATEPAPTAAPTTAAVALPPTLIPTAADAGDALPNFNTAVILDASGSMRAALGTRDRLAIAQDAVANLSGELPAGVNASLWVYGHRVEQDDMDASCQDIEEVISLSTVDPERFDDLAHSFVAKGYTPISDALQQAADSLPLGQGERNTIILVSDGEETCGGDPCALARALAESQSQVTIHAIGLAVDQFTRTQLICIAEAAGGIYADADDAGALDDALQNAAGAAISNESGYFQSFGMPIDVALSADNRHLYVLTRVGAEVHAFARDEQSGRLRYLGTPTIAADDYFLSNPTVMTLTADDRHLYVAGAGQKSILTFSRDGESGRLTFSNIMPATADGLPQINLLTAIVASADGAYVYVAAADFGRVDDLLLVYRRDAATGALSLEQQIGNDETYYGLASVAEIAISDDGGRLYAAGDKRLGLFARDAASGRLSWIEALGDDSAIGLGLWDGFQVESSADNRDLYVAAMRPDLLTHFRQDATGHLAVAAQLNGNLPDNPSLHGAHGLLLSTDDRHLYVAARVSELLFVFGRDAADGSLRLLQQLGDADAAAAGTAGITDMVLSDDGLFLYAAGHDADQIAVFQRDPASGLLTPAQSFPETHDQP